MKIGENRGKFPEIGENFGGKFSGIFPGDKKSPEISGNFRKKSVKNDRFWKIQHPFKKRTF